MAHLLLINVPSIQSFRALSLYLLSWSVLVYRAYNKVQALLRSKTLFRTLSQVFRPSCTLRKVCKRLEHVLYTPNTQIVSPRAPVRAQNHKGLKEVYKVYTSEVKV